MNHKCLIKWRVTYFIVISFLAINLHAQKTQSLPNIIFIVADDMGDGDVKAFNSESKISTPHLNKLAESGMMFTDAHASGSFLESGKCCSGF